MKLRFDPDQPHQRAAIDAVLGLLAGAPCTSLAEALAAGQEHGVVANRLALPAEELLRRIQATQRAAGLPVSAKLPFEGGAPQISVEMETGTGKTYVYLRTLLELSRRQGLRKAIVVVPSVAVREGVLGTLRAAQEHFEALMPGLRVRAFGYDGARLHRLRAFVGSPQAEIMVLGLDAFNKAVNRMRRPHDAFGGRAPLELLAAVRPLLVLDEPQRMESSRSRAALADLAPSLVLRYSATHRRPHALVHRLTPRQAFAQGLVKRIEVAAPAAGLHERAARIAAQVEATVALHARRQAELLPRGIKVLSLLFVERVADWADDDGLVRRALQQSFDALAREHPWLGGRTASQACAAYFAVQRQRGGRARAIDSITGKSVADEEAYALIMRDKARLLSLDEPVSFVVSHSALREGWDNPNVFQICTLAPSRAAMKKRQEVGRGVRLCVDQDGRRVLDPAVNVLTVVANDSYEEYVAGLQAEDAQTLGEADAAPPPRPVGPGEVRAHPHAGADAGPPPWRTIDAKLCEHACAAARQAVATRAAALDRAQVVPDPVARVTALLLRRRPPCLVSQPTIAAVLEVLREPEAGPLGWWHVEAAAGAIAAALGEA